MLRQFPSYPIAVLLLSLIGCKKPYEPPAILSADNLLVVDGVINANPGGETSIILSRTRRLTDTMEFVAEAGARVSIESNHNENFLLNEKPEGKYTSNPLALAAGKQYRLRIRTADGTEYESEFVSLLQTPPIDSVTWNQDQHVFIYVNTHDPQNNTRYYRWDFVETWEYHSVYESILEFVNGQIVFRDPANYVDRCYDSAAAPSILTSSTVRLAEDIVKDFQINRIERNSDKISVRYSILVKQYALTRKAFDYWQIVRKNAEDLGTLFDAQPAQLFGNIRNINNKNEPVIGYISGAAVQEKRIFIRRAQLEGEQNQPMCNEIFTTPAEAVSYLKDPNISPAYNTTGGGVVLAKTLCVDCRTKGGTTTKPLYWP